MVPIDRISVAVLFLAINLGCSEQARSPSSNVAPVETTVCAILDSPETFDGRYIETRAYAVTDGIHYRALVDRHCLRSLVRFYLPENSTGASDLVDALGLGWGRPSETEIQGTFVGYYEFESEDRRGYLRVVEVKDVVVEPGEDLLRAVLENSGSVR